MGLYRDIIPIMENQKDKKMENETEGISLDYKTRLASFGFSENREDFVVTVFEH